jgi:hypothetical protein
VLLEAFGAHCREMATADHRPDCHGKSQHGWGVRTVRPDPACPGCVTALDRAIWQRLADECALWLRQKTTDDTQETLA